MKHCIICGNEIPVRGGLDAIPHTKTCKAECSATRVRNRKRINSEKSRKRARQEAKEAKAAAAKS